MDLTLSSTVALLGRGACTCWKTPRLSAALIKGISNSAFLKARGAGVRVRVILHQEATCCTNPLCTNMLICIQSVGCLFFFCFESQSRRRGDSKHFPNPCSTSLLSAFLHPNARFFFFCLSGKSCFISPLEILGCQSDQLPVSRALHGFL